jgi:serine/threonine-protein phosphatase PP1 catalytic subunit
MEKFEDYGNFHLVLGNHELCHILNKDIYKNRVNQKKAFEKLLFSYYGNKESLEEYIDFFKKWSIAIKTENGIFISHGGPSYTHSLKDLELDSKDFDYKSFLVDDLLWRRFHHFREKEIDEFLRAIGSKFMVVGHTRVKGFQVHGKQLIISSTGKNNKAYLNLNLNEKITSMEQLTGSINFL